MEKQTDKTGGNLTKTNNQPGTETSQREPFRKPDHEGAGQMRAGSEGKNFMEL